MFKNLFCYYTILIVTGLSAQTTPKRFQFGVNYSADYAFRTLKNNDGGPFAQMVIDLRDDSEKAKYGFTTGLNVLFTVNNHLEIGAGVQYSNKGYQIPHIEVDGIMPQVYQDGRVISSLNYIDVPLKANFILGSGKLRGLVGAGIVANFLVSSTLRTVYKAANGDEAYGKYTNSADYERFNLSPMVSAGVDYQLNDRVHVRLEPTFRYGILKTVDAPVTMYVWNPGLNASCYFSL
jgi:opacity protein-like surface antigen